MLFYIIETFTLQVSSSNQRQQSAFQPITERKTLDLSATLHHQLLPSAFSSPATHFRPILLQTDMMSVVDNFSAENGLNTGNIVTPRRKDTSSNSRVCKNVRDRNTTPENTFSREIVAMEVSDHSEKGVIIDKQIVQPRKSSPLIHGYRNFQTPSKSDDHQACERMSCLSINDAGEHYTKADIDLGKKLDLILNELRKINPHTDTNVLGEVIAQHLKGFHIKDSEDLVHDSVNTKLPEDQNVNNGTPSCMYPTMSMDSDPFNQSLRMSSVDSLQSNIYFQAEDGRAFPNSAACAPAEALNTSTVTERSKVVPLSGCGQIGGITTQNALFSSSTDLTPRLSFPIQADSKSDLAYLPTASLIQMFTGCDKRPTSHISSLRNSDVVNTSANVTFNSEHNVDINGSEYVFLPTVSSVDQHFTEIAATNETCLGNHGNVFRSPPVKQCVANPCHNMANDFDLKNNNNILPRSYLVCQASAPLKNAVSPELSDLWYTFSNDYHGYCNVMNASAGNFTPYLVQSIVKATISPLPKNCDLNRGDENMIESERFLTSMPCDEPYHHLIVAKVLELVLKYLRGKTSHTIDQQEIMGKLFMFILSVN